MTWLICTCRLCAWGRRGGGWGLVWASPDYAFRSSRIRGVVILIVVVVVVDTTHTTTHTHTHTHTHAHKAASAPCHLHSRTTLSS